MKTSITISDLGRALSLWKLTGLIQGLTNVMALAIGGITITDIKDTQCHRLVGGLRETFGIMGIEKRLGAKKEAFGRMGNGSHLKYQT